MEKKLHIIGPFNTGTNLVHNIIHNSICTDSITNKIIMPRNIYNKPFQKHTICMKSIEEYLTNPNNLLIIMYKNVYNWIYSVKKTSYDIKYTELHLPIKLYSSSFSNIIDLYNYYYNNYMALLIKYSNAIFLDYESVIDLDTSYDYINSKLDKLNLKLMSKNNLLATLNVPSKPHGNSVKDSKEAKEKYQLNQITFQQYVNDNTSLKNSVSSELLHFYENTKLKT